MEALSLFYSLTVLSPSLSAAEAQRLASPALEEAAAIALRLKMPYLFFANVKKLSLASLLKPDTLAVFKKEEQTAVQRGLYWMGRLRQLATLLKEGGIDFVPLKGSSLVTGTYQDPGLRYSLDLDIFIELRQFAACRAVLEKNGFRLAPHQLKNGVFIDKGRECTFVGPDGAEVDVHYRFFQWHIERHVFKVSSADIFADRLRGVSWRGVPLDRLRWEDEFYYLLLCLAGDHFSEFRYYADADALVRVHGDAFDWARVKAHVDRSPVRRLLREAMRFMRTRLGTSIPPDGEEDAEAKAPAPALHGLFQRRFFYFMAAERVYDKIALVAVFMRWKIFSVSGLFKRYFIEHNNPEGELHAVTMETQ